MSRLAFAWASLGLMALGCPLLVDDRLEIVPSNDAAPVDPAAAGAGIAGAPATEPTNGGAPSKPGPSAGHDTAGSAPGGAATAGATCGVTRLPGAGVACPPLCDRCENGLCIFDCSSQAQCEGLLIACPPGLGCRVECSAQAACNKAEIVCPAAFDCELECAEQDSCKEATLVCSDANCNVRCLAEKACEKSRVRCSSARCGAECLGPEHAPMFDCREACACNPC